MQLAVSRELYAYWDTLRAGRSAPERNDIDPGAIRGILADTFVLDFDPKRGFPFRIAGSRANALFLRELRGFPFLQLWRESDRGRIEAAVRCAADSAQPQVLEGEASAPGLETLEIETTLLPLRQHGSTHTRVLGSIGADAAPHWLGLVGVGPARLKSIRALDPAKSSGADGAALEADCSPSFPDAGSRRERRILRLARIPQELNRPAAVQRSASIRFRPPAY